MFNRNSDPFQAYEDGFKAGMQAAFSRINHCKFIYSTEDLCKVLKVSRDLLSACLNEHNPTKNFDYIEVGHSHTRYYEKRYVANLTKVLKLSKYEEVLTQKSAQLKDTAQSKEWYTAHEAYDLYPVARSQCSSIAELSKLMACAPEATSQNVLNDGKSRLFRSDLVEDCICQLRVLAS